MPLSRIEVHKSAEYDQATTTLSLEHIELNLDPGDYCHVKTDKTDGGSIEKKWQGIVSVGITVAQQTHGQLENREKYFFRY